MRQEMAGWREMTHVQTPFLQTLEPCVYVHTHEDVRMCADKTVQQKMCVQQVSVCTLSVVHTSRHYMCTNTP